MELGKELKILGKDGYKCAIVGELLLEIYCWRSIVGVPPQGIEGNIRDGVTIMERNF